MLSLYIYIYKSELTNKMKQIFPSSGRVDTSVWMH